MGDRHNRNTSKNTGTHVNGTGPQRPTQDTGSLTEYRAVVRQEIRELQEREKRRSSVVIKGLASTTPAGVVSEFGDVTSSTMGTRVTLSEVVKIPNNELWRAKIFDTDKRKLVLDQAKKLKGSQYHHIFIRKDLTFAQRAELRQRRESLAQTTTRTFWPSHQVPAPSASGQGVTPSTSEEPGTSTDVSTPRPPTQTPDAPMMQQPAAERADTAEAPNPASTSSTAASSTSGNVQSN